MIVCDMQAWIFKPSNLLLFFFLLDVQYFQYVHISKRIELMMTPNTNFNFSED